MEEQPLLQFLWSSSAAAAVARDRHCWLLSVEELPHLAEAESIMTALFREMWALIGDWRERCVDACHGDEPQREAVGERSRKNTHEWSGQLARDTCTFNG